MSEESLRRPKQEQIHIVQLLDQCYRVGRKGRKGIHHSIMYCFERNRLSPQPHFTFEGQEYAQIARVLSLSA